jgi:hypothetical protein
MTSRRREYVPSGAVSNHPFKSLGTGVGQTFIIPESALLYSLVSLYSADLPTISMRLWTKHLATYSLIRVSKLLAVSMLSRVEIKASRSR